MRIFENVWYFLKANNSDYYIYIINISIVQITNVGHCEALPEASTH